MSSLAVTPREEALLCLVSEALSFAEAGTRDGSPLLGLGADPYNHDFPDEVTVTMNGLPEWRLLLVRA
ncbi:MAG: hypothetical protein ACYDAG_07570 [Chloroflexota bacterium]